MIRRSSGTAGRCKLSLFEPVFDREFDSDLERNFARYLDEQKALRWWHRVAVRQRGDYYLRGWKQERIWPDFVAMAGESGTANHSCWYSRPKASTCATTRIPITSAACWTPLRTLSTAEQ